MLRLVIFLLCTFPAFGQAALENISSLIEKKQYLMAKEQAEELVVSYPENAKLYELLGDVYSHLKDWDKAIDVYENLVALDPYSAAYHYKYGGALGMKAQSVSKLRALVIIGDVETAFLKAAKLDSNHIDARWALVYYYLNVPGLVGGSTTKALVYAKELLALSPVDGHLALGQVYGYKKDFKNAETHYKQAVAVGGSKTCYTHLANLYVTFKKYPLAIDTLQEAYNKLGDSHFLHRISEVKAKMD